jgi:hypothetical protein
MWVSVSALSEPLRMWTGEDGKRFEGTFVRELLGRVQIRDTKDQLQMISVDKLAKADLKYLQESIVPEVDIKIRKETDLKPEMEWTISGDKTTLYTCKITIEKKSDMDCKTGLTAELYLIADEEDGDNYILIERAENKFVFPEGRDSKIEWIVEKIPIRRYFSGWAVTSAKWRGGTYLGYIVTVLDPKGNVVASKTDISNVDWMDDGLPAAVEKLRQLAYEGRGSVYSRHFDSKIRKSRLPRIEWHKRTSFF